MARSNAKLKAIELGPDPARQPLADALGKVEKIKASIAENERQQAEARSKIVEAEAAADKAEKDLASAPALQRRTLRAELQEATETLQDYRDHLGELRDRAKSLTADLDFAQNDVRFARSDLAKNHPHAADLLARLQSFRAETAQVIADLAALDAIGGIPETARGWSSSSAPNPPPSPALVTWLAALLTDASAELTQ